MDRTRFVWLAPATTDARGRRLETGKAYDAADFEPDALGAWVEAGAARFEDTGKARAKKPEAQE